MRLLLASLAVAALALGGCAVKPGDLVGYWSGEVVLSDAALDAAVKSATAATSGIEVTREDIVQLLEDQGSGLTLNGDGTFTMEIGTAPYEGKWKLVEGEVRLSTTKINGHDPVAWAEFVGAKPEFAEKLKQPWRLKLAKNLSSMTGTDPSDEGTTVTFKRQ